MKKISLLVTSLCLSLALCSCGEESSSVPSESTSSESSLTENPITIVTRDDELAIGQTIALAYRVEGNLDVVFSSSDPEVATVDDYGQVSGVSEGTVTITIALADNPSVSASIELSVYKPFFLTEQGYINGTVDTRDARDGVVTIGGGQTQLLVTPSGSTPSIPSATTCSGMAFAQAGMALAASSPHITAGGVTKPGSPTTRIWSRPSRSSLAKGLISR